jgi:YD repeat-containing protein
MGGVRFGGARLVSVRAGGSCRLPAGVLAVQGLGCLAALLATILALMPASASAALPEIEVRHMPEIEEWVYRNAGVKSVGCGEVCAKLWSAEHGSIPALVSSQEMWDRLGELETDKTGLWGTMKGFGSSLQGAWPFSTSQPFLVGWRINSNGEGVIWLEIVGPKSPEGVSVPICGHWDVIFKARGEKIGSTFHESAFAPGHEWYMDECGTTEMVSQFAAAENPESPGSNCGDNGLTVLEWTRQEWWWNTCNEGTNKGQPVTANVYGQAFYKQFHFSRPEEWKSQKLEGEYSHNIEMGGTDPGSAVVKEATEHTLEESYWLQRWVQWVLEGEHGANPLGTAPEEEYGVRDPSAPNKPECMTGKPVNCATGNEVETQTDLTVGGRGPGLSLTRTYNSQLAAKQTAHGQFGYGWTSSYSAHVEVSEEGKLATVYQDGGGTARFLRSGEQWVATNPLVQAKLSAEGSGYLYTLPDQTVLRFDSSGRLSSETDRNGNGLTMNRNGERRLESVSDPVGRKLTFAYNTEGLIESAKDPLGNTVKYAYEAGNLASVVLSGETSSRWQFKYDASHRLTTMTDGRSGKTTTEYDSSNRVISQTDPTERTLTFEYEPSHTKITNKTTGAVTDEHFTIDNEPTSVTRGYGTSSATTQESSYDSSGNLVSVTDGNKHTTSYGYDSAGNRTSMIDANKNETKWTYNSTHDVETTTTPKGETTTIKREAHGNPETIERPAPGSKTQITKYKYKSTGELESVEDPLKRVWKYEYDTHGNRTAEVDPLSDKRTWEYNEDSQETATVSPRGNVMGGKPSEFTTKIERDNQGRPLKITDPLGHTTKYKYDGDGNVETFTDGNSHTTTYTYNSDNQPTKVEAPNKAITETEYDGAGQVVSQTDGNKNTTKYIRNPVEEVTEVTDPLGRVTKKEYDAAGNLKTLEDPAKRTTTYKYDPANRLEEVSYSDGKTPAVKYEYDADGDRTKMVDGTGTTKYTYDQLDRLTEGENGHKEVSKYEYDLANQQTKITYPNTKSVTRAFDKAGRLEKITDWSSNITKFTYNADSGQVTTLFPSATKDEDKYAYNNADQMSEAKMLKLLEKGSETLALLVYTRDNNGEVKKTTSKGLPGAEITENTYDENNRLTKSGSEYKYDAANNATTIGAGAYKYDKGSELETGPSLTYTYNELGERTKPNPPAARRRHTAMTRPET